MPYARSLIPKMRSSMCWTRLCSHFPAFRSSIRPSTKSQSGRNTVRKYSCSVIIVAGTGSSPGSICRTVVRVAMPQYAPGAPFLPVNSAEKAPAGGCLLVRKIRSAGHTLKLDSWERGLDAEARSAAAGALYRGVLELEAGGFQSLHVVDGAVLQVHRGGRVQEHLQVIELVHLVHH